MSAKIRNNAARDVVIKVITSNFFVENQKGVAKKMSEKGKTETASSKNKDAFQAEFEALPLDEKFSRLFKMEAATIGETINYVVDNSSKMIEKAVEAMNDLGRKAQTDCSEKKAAEDTSDGKNKKAESKKS